MNDGIRLAAKQDIPALCEIWEQCFADGKEYIELFYKSNFERMKTYALFADGKPVSMLHMIDAALKHNDISQPAKFIYATGTLPEYRKKGCMSALIKHVIEQANKNGYALFLKPSSPSTSKFYTSLGFDAKTSLKLVVLTPSESQELTVNELSFKEYNRMREKAFGNIPHVKWDDAHIEWCVEENKLFSGKTLEIEFDGTNYFLMGYPEGKTLVIDETDLSVNQLKNISGALCGIYKAERIKALMPANCTQGERIDFALLCNSQINEPYVNLIMI